MSSVTKFFRSIGIQLKNVLGVRKSHLAYQAFASDEEFQTACRVNDELQFRRRCMIEKAKSMRKSRRQGCRAQHRWNRNMRRKVARKNYDIPSYWNERGEYVNDPAMRPVRRCVSIVDLRETQEDVVEVTQWKKPRKGSPRHPFLDAEEGFSARLLSLSKVDKTKSSVSDIVSRVLPCVKFSTQSVKGSGSSDSIIAFDMRRAPRLWTAEMFPEQRFAFAGIMSEPNLLCTEMKLKPDDESSEMKFNYVRRCPARTSSQRHLESIILMNHFARERSRPRHWINVDEWTENYIAKLREHYNLYF